MNDNLLKSTSETTSQSNISSSADPET